MNHCRIHGNTRGSGRCRSCHEEFCEPCLVYAYGCSKPPYCLRCALVAAGTTPTPAWSAEFSFSA